MLIRTQDRKALINFKNVSSLNIISSDGSYRIYVQNLGDYRHFLGQYSTLGQAMEILDEIETFYTDKMASRLIYPMPSDDGVIWEDRHGEVDA